MLTMDRLSQAAGQSGERICALQPEMMALDRAVCVARTSPAATCLLALEPARVFGDPGACIDPRCAMAQGVPAP